MTRREGPREAPSPAARAKRISRARQAQRDKPADSIPAPIPGVACPCGDRWLPLPVGLSEVSRSRQCRACGRPFRWEAVFE